MKKENLLKQIAEAGYSVGFGAKKHFSTYDIVEKVPGIVSFLSIAVGILTLVFDVLDVKEISALLLILGIMVLYVERYDNKKYNNTAEKMMRIFNEIKSLYFTVLSSDKTDFADEQAKLDKLYSEFNSISISNQIFFSDWFAHYKFFWRHQIDWMDQQLKFKLIKDKIPLTASVCVVAIILTVLYFVVCKIFFVWNSCN